MLSSTCPMPMPTDRVGRFTSGRSRRASCITRANTSRWSSSAQASALDTLTKASTSSPPAYTSDPWSSTCTMRRASAGERRELRGELPVMLLVAEFTEARAHVVAVGDDAGHVGVAGRASSRRGAPARRAPAGPCLRVVGVGVSGYRSRAIAAQRSRDEHLRLPLEGRLSAGTPRGSGHGDRRSASRVATGVRARFHGHLDPPGRGPRW